MGFPRGIRNMTIQQQEVIVKDALMVGLFSSLGNNSIYWRVEYRSSGRDGLIREECQMFLSPDVLVLRLVFSTGTSYVFHVSIPA
ncbi:hypothetical protein AVEN_261420-1 [Araneus ventricosus]|uniref:Uncharacterized protein n=1 Tax=Araneus ventricosus TaxID=182803 RepID=A0A4Y2GVC0_ARAVE|nr:hypothetical protein AVEN_261420-1 [Araneus ventricosus]